MILITPLLLLCADGAPAFPRVRAVPQPQHVVAFEADGEQVAAYHYSPAHPRPFVFPLLGPAGERLTRLGHPHDPQGHRHHWSIWASHHDVDGINFWTDDSDARVVHLELEKVVDGAESATVIAKNTWRDGEGRDHLIERRTVTLHALEGGERYLDLTLEFQPVGEETVLGQTPFGFLGVRMAKTIGVNDGGGRILNSEGAVNEKEVFRKPARWVDYSGLVAPGMENGIALFDHPRNPRHPVAFHVRNDGWMGASHFLDAPLTLKKGDTLTLRYRLYAHGPGLDREQIDAHWQRFAGE
jgi:methane monooxygenase PmoA-like